MRVLRKLPGLAVAGAVPVAGAVAMALVLAPPEAAAGDDGWKGRYERDAHGGWYGRPGWGTPGWGAPGWGTPRWGTPGWGPPGWGPPRHYGPPRGYGYYVPPRVFHPPPRFYYPPPRYHYGPRGPGIGLHFRF